MCTHTLSLPLSFIFSHTNKAFASKFTFRQARSSAHFRQRGRHLPGWRSKSCVRNISVETNSEPPPWFSSRMCPPHQSEARLSISKGPNSARATEHVISHGHTHSSNDEGWKRSVWEKKKKKSRAEPKAAETLKFWSEAALVPRVDVETSEVSKIAWKHPK